MSNADSALATKKQKILEVFIEIEVSSVLRLGFRLCNSVFVLLLCAAHNASLLVVSDALLEEVCLAGQRDVLHEVKGVSDFVELLVAEGEQESVGDKLDVLLHEVCVHAEKCARECLCQEFLFDGNSFGDNVLNGLFTGSVF